MRILIKNGWIVNEGRTFKGSIVIENDYIQSVLEDERSLKYLEGKSIVKVITVPRKIINIVIK